MTKYGYTSLIAVALGFGVATQSNAQVAPTRVTAAGSRALAKALDLIQNHYGVEISYEDAEYTFGGDLMDVTDLGWWKQHPDDPRRSLTPRGGSLSIEFPPSFNGDRLSSAFSAVARMLSAHDLQQLPGRFRLVQDGATLFVVPREVRNTAGVWVAATSPLDSSVDIRRQDWNALKLVQEIADQISKRTGREVGLGNVPMNFLMNQHVELEAHGEPARQVLTRLFREGNWRVPAAPLPRQDIMWRLYYSPGGRNYALNLDAPPGPPQDDSKWLTKQE